MTDREQLIRDRMERLPIEDWDRQGTLIYALESVRKPYPHERNRVSARVDGGPRTPDIELERWAEFFQGAQNDVCYLLNKLDELRDRERKAVQELIK